MILSFSTKQKNGQPTYFVEKIWRGLEQLSPVYKEYSKEWFQLYFKKFGKYWDCDTRLSPKLTTIREDKHDRWHAGVLIHFIVFPRTKRMFQFAPVIHCISTQKIEIEYIDPNRYPIIVIDGTHFYNEKLGIDHGLKKLIENDGFYSVDDFFNWFKADFEGKIIHWTDLRY